MTLQEIFDKVYLGMESQGWRKSTRMVAATSLHPAVECCAYRGENGLKCAAGQLIPDELYDVEFEDQAFYSDDFKIIHNKLDLTEVQINFVSMLQNAHDNYTDIKRRFEDIAQLFILTIPENKGS